MYRSYKIRLKPTAKQRRALTTILALSCDLYNASLQERRDAWALRRKSISYQDQTASLTKIRAEDEDVRTVAVDIAREPLRRVDRAFKAFMRRCRAKEKPGFPRFRSKERYDSFTFGLPRIIVDRLVIPKLGHVKFKASQVLKGTLKTATIIRRRNRWEARIICDVGLAPKKIAISTVVGIDLGLTNFVTLSNGISIDNPHWLKRHEAKIAQANQALARKQRGSNNRVRARLALNRAYERVVDARRNFIHHVSKYLVTNYNLIAYEDLNIKGMVQSNFSKSINDAAWGELIWQISYKAESAGRWAVPVNPKNTSQMCSTCGTIVKKTLANRVHICPCGLTLDRDHNAAINILTVGLGKSLEQ